MTMLTPRAIAPDAAPGEVPQPDCSRCGAPAAGFIAVEHELRTPLTVIRAVTEILRDCPELPADERERLLAAAISELDRLDGTVESILDPWRNACNCFTPA